MRYGLIRHADGANLLISSMEAKEMERPHLTLSAETLGENNYIRVFGEKIPIFSPGITGYKGEAIFAVFASDYETADILAREAEITYEEVNKEEGEETAKTRKDEYSYGNILAFSEKENDDDGSEKSNGIVKLEHSYMLNKTTSPSHIIFKTTSWHEGANLHVMVPTEYPMLVKKCVSEVTGVRIERVVIHQLEYHSPNDEYFLTPIKTACIAALATESLKVPVEIRESAYSERGEVKYNFTTYMKDGKPLAEQITLEAELGKYPYLWREYQRQAMAAIIPYYPLEALSVEIKIKTSDERPSTLFGSLGYAEALGASEYHISEMARVAKMSPLAYRFLLLGDKRKFTDYIPALESDELKKVLDNIGKKSYFERKWFSCHQQRGDFGLIEKLRGIGIASGVGISGFSTTFITENEFQAVMTYTQKNTVQINSSAFSHGTALKFWKTMIKEEMGLESEEQVIFLPFGPDTKDSGPKILSRFICNFSQQLISGAKRLKQLRESEKPPFSLIIDVENKFSPCEFDPSSFGAMIIEVVIKESAFSLEVTRLWAEFSLESVAEEEKLMNSIKQNILKTIARLGATISDNAKMSISFSHKNSAKVASTSELVRALTTSALANALREALGDKEAFLPVTSESLRKAIREKGGQA